MRVYLSLISGSLLGALVASQNETDPCGGVCHPDAPCTEGNADFSSHPTDINGVPFEFHKQLNENGYYCECPDNLTGVRCNRPYEVCEGDSGHVCYHGGKCIDGLNEVVSDDLLFCDCSEAEYNGSPYVGKYCETQGATQCGDSEIFCANGGKCAEYFESKAHPCECPVGHRGPHCEFDTGFVPECTLECQNEGVCTLGIKDYDTAFYSEFWATHDGTFQYCACKPGWFGLGCETKGQVCGQNHCFNGGSCLQTEHSDGEVDYECDCSTANTDETSYAGEFCENEATSFCSKDVDQNGQLFCTNGGSCQDDGVEHCECPEGFHGPLCQYRAFQDAEECTLNCQNGGSCRSGKKDNTLFKQFGDELMKFNETHRLWEHCVCPDGYFGVQCEHQLEICPGGEHVCLHGSKCIAQNSTDGLSHSCDCDLAQNSSQFAGKYCQYSSTQICTASGEPGVGQASFAFCVNNGECNATVNDDESHPGCTCKDGFTGNHCEFLATALSEPTPAPITAPVAAPVASTPISQNANDEEGSSNGLVVALAVALVVLLLLLGSVVFRRYRSRREPSTFINKTIDVPKSPVTREEYVEEETVDMQSTEASPVKVDNLQTVEII